MGELNVIKPDDEDADENLDNRAYDGAIRSN
jgi:hypothetical protein